MSREPARRRSGGPDRLDGLMDGALRSMRIRGQVRDAQLQLVFGEVVGPAVASMCRALRLERSTLVVGVSNGPLAHQLQIDSPRLIESLNTRLGADVVTRLRFQPL